MQALIAIAGLAAGVLLSRFAPGWSIYFILGVSLLILMDYLAPPEEEKEEEVKKD